MPVRAAFLTVLLSVMSNSSAFADGTEGRGNAPLPSGYVKNAALLPLANHKSRVYWREVNGDLYCFYRGDAAALNEFVKLFAGTQEPVREAILLPGPGQTHMFDQTPIACDWQVHFTDGFYLRFAQKEKDTQVMDKHPTLTVFINRVAPKSPPDAKQVLRWIVELNNDKFTVREQAQKELEKLGVSAETALRRALEGKPSEEARRRIESLLAKLDGVDLDHVRIPDGVAVLELSDLIARYKAGLKSESNEIRGHAIGHLGYLAAYTDETIPLVIEVLKTDKHEYVRRYAASSLGQFGARAKAALPILKEGLTDPDKNIRHAFEQVIEKIEKNESVPAEKLEQLEGLRTAIARQVKQRAGVR